MAIAGTSGRAIGGGGRARAGVTGTPAAERGRGPSRGLHFILWPPVDHHTPHRP